MKWATLLVVLLSLLSACGIPDLKPFGDATAAMASQLRSAFEKTQVAIGFAAATAEDQSDFGSKSKELEKRWVPTRRAIAALVEYSDSLAALAEAGKKGKETVARLTGAVNELATAVGALPLAGTAEEVVKAVGAKIIEIKAERDIKKAVLQAIEAVDLLAPLLKQNFADLHNIHKSAANAWEAHLRGESSILMNYYESLVAEERRLQFLLTLIVQYQSAADRLRFRAARARTQKNDALAEKLEGSIAQEQDENLNALRDFDSTLAGMDLTADTAAKVETRQQQLMDLINAQRKEIALLEPKYKQAIADLDRVSETRQLGARVLDKAADAIDAWQKAHKSLRAVAEGQQSRPSIAELASIVKEIAALVK